MCKPISDHNHMFDMQAMYRMSIFKIHTMTLLGNANVQNSHRPYKVHTVNQVNW